MEGLTLRFINLLPTGDEALAELTPTLSTWFRDRIGAPTPIQRGGWPTIRRGDNALLVAPTGTGKTLAAFLPLLSRLPTPTDGLIGIVIAPLKALCADQFKHLTAIVPPGWKLALRTGDTPTSERRKQKLDPPHLLWTTPESLAILLTQIDFRRRVRELRWVIVDEVHAFAPRKRGCDLALSLERLEALTEVGPLQRVGLSATCEPLDAAAGFLVGADRSCSIVHIPDATGFDMRIEPLPAAPLSGFIARLVDRLIPEIEANRTTLIFANTRNVCERIGYALRKRMPEQAEAIATHHGSLAASRRKEIESMLRDGQSRAVVSSASLELGIDIGAVDGVVFANPPGDVARMMQRLGRAGHRPGRLRRGLLLCAHPQEILEAAVTSASGRFGRIEPLAIPEAPLDVLCQHLVGMGIGATFPPDAAFDLVRRAFPYRHLRRDDFDACLDYLLGCPEPDGTTWLPARLQRVEGGVAIASRRTELLMRRNLGTIVTEEPRLVRLETQDGSIIVGELDEAYADRLKPGDRFLLDGRCLIHRRRVGRELIVGASSGYPLVPRWGSNGPMIAEDLARRLYLTRHEAALALRDGPAELARLLRDDFALGPAAADELADYIRDQETRSEIPAADTMLIEAIDRGFAWEYALHTPLHAAGNEAIARVVQRRIGKLRQGNVEVVAVTLGIMIVHESDAPLEEAEWDRLLELADFEDDLNVGLDDGSLVRQRFGEVAQVGLMTLRQPLGGKRKVGGRQWVEQRLFDQIRQVAPDFVLLRQARRETRETTCDVDAAVRFLRQDRSLSMRYLSEPSPFAAAWLESGEEAFHLLGRATQRGDELPSLSDQAARRDSD